MPFFYFKNKKNYWRSSSSVAHLQIVVPDNLFQQKFFFAKTEAGKSTSTAVIIMFSFFRKLLIYGIVILGLVSVLNYWMARKSYLVDYRDIEVIAKRNLGMYVSYL